MFIKKKTLVEKEPEFFIFPIYISFKKKFSPFFFFSWFVGTIFLNLCVDIPLYLLYNCKCFWFFYLMPSFDCESFFRLFFFFLVGFALSLDMGFSFIFFPHGKENIDKLLCLSHLIMLYKKKEKFKWNILYAFESVKIKSNKSKAVCVPITPYTQWWWL